MDEWENYLREFLGSTTPQSVLDFIAWIGNFIFTWVFLMPISVVVSGKLLTHRLAVRGGSGQSFVLSVGKRVKIQAKNEEVILGFFAFIAILFVSGLAFGPVIYSKFVNQFGLDLGQFNTLLVFSSFATLFISGVSYLRSPTSRRDEELRNTHTKRIMQVSHVDAGEIKDG